MSEQRRRIGLRCTKVSGLELVLQNLSFSSFLFLHTTPRPGDIALARVISLGDAGVNDDQPFILISRP